MPDDASGGDRAQHNPVVFQPVFEGIPSQLERISEALDYPLAFQLVERLNPGFEGIAQQGECRREVDETVFPTGFEVDPENWTAG